MSEYIKREDVEKMIQEQFALDDKDLRHIKQMVIDQLPSIDIVRCKDCKHRWEGKCLYWKFPTVVFDDDYCSYGERKEQEEC